MGARAGAKIVLRCPHPPISPRRQSIKVRGRHYLPLTTPIDYWARKVRKSDTRTRVEKFRGPKWPMEEVWWLGVWGLNGG
jgi:hypothetical protein